MFAVLARYPSVETLAVAIKATEKPAMKKEAEQAIFQMAPKLVGKSPEAEQMLAKAGIEVPRMEIIKADTSRRRAGRRDRSSAIAGQRDATNLAPLGEVQRELWRRSRSGRRQATQGAIPHQRQGGEATFAEDAEIDLPLPK